MDHPPIPPNSKYFRYCVSEFDPKKTWYEFWMPQLDGTCERWLIGNNEASLIISLVAQEEWGLEVDRLMKIKWNILQEQHEAENNILAWFEWKEKEKIKGDKESV
jgi:hypothetical protein